jgi:hypothetical protein
MGLFGFIGETLNEAKWIMSDLLDTSEEPTKGQNVVALIAFIIMVVLLIMWA